MLLKSILFWIFILLMIQLTALSASRKSNGTVRRLSKVLGTVRHLSKVRIIKAFSSGSSLTTSKDQLERNVRIWSNSTQPRTVLFKDASHSGNKSTLHNYVKVILDKFFPDLSSLVNSTEKMENIAQILNNSEQARSAFNGFFYSENKNKSIVQHNVNEILNELFSDRRKDPIKKIFQILNNSTQAKRVFNGTFDSGNENKSAVRQYSNAMISKPSSKVNATDDCCSKAQLVQSSSNINNITGYGNLNIEKNSENNSSKVNATDDCCSKAQLFQSNSNINNIMDYGNIDKIIKHGSSSVNYTDGCCSTKEPLQFNSNINNAHLEKSNFKESNKQNPNLKSKNNISRNETKKTIFLENTYPTINRICAEENCSKTLNLSSSPYKNTTTETKKLNSYDDFITDKGEFIASKKFDDKISRNEFGNSVVFGNADIKKNNKYNSFELNKTENCCYVPLNSNIRCLLIENNPGCINDTHLKKLNFKESDRQNQDQKVKNKISKNERTESKKTIFLVNNTYSTTNDTYIPKNLPENLNLSSPHNVSSSKYIKNHVGNNISAGKVDNDDYNLHSALMINKSMPVHFLHDIFPSDYDTHLKNNVSADIVDFRQHNLNNSNETSINKPVITLDSGRLTSFKIDENKGRYKSVPKTVINKYGTDYDISQNCTHQSCSFRDPLEKYGDEDSIVVGRLEDFKPIHNASLKSNAVNNKDDNIETVTYNSFVSQIVNSRNETKADTVNRINNNKQLTSLKINQNSKARTAANETLPSGEKLSNNKIIDLIRFGDNKTTLSFNSSAAEEEVGKKLFETVEYFILGNAPQKCCAQRNNSSCTCDARNKTNSLNPILFIEKTKTNVKAQIEKTNGIKTDQIAKTKNDCNKSFQTSDDNCRGIRFKTATIISSGSRLKNCIEDTTAYNIIISHYRTYHHLKFLDLKCTIKISTTVRGRKSTFEIAHAIEEDIFEKYKGSFNVLLSNMEQEKNHSSFGNLTLSKSENLSFRNLTNDAIREKGNILNVFCGLVVVIVILILILIYQCFFYYKKKRSFDYDVRVAFSNAAIPRVTIISNREI